MTKRTDKSDIFPKELPVPLSDDEIRFRGLELNEKLGELDKLDDELKTLKDEQKIKRQQIDKRIKEIREQIDDKAEEREVECQEIYHFSLRSAVTIRLDTGGEVSTRPLKPAEMQGDLLLLPGQGKVDDASGDKE